MQFLVIRSPDDGDIEFADANDARVYLADLQQRWTWVAQVDAGLYHHLAGLISNVSSNIGSGSHQAQADHTFMVYRFPVQGGSLEMLIDDLAKTDRHAATTVLGLVLRYVSINLHDRHHMKALSTLVAFEQKLTSQSVEAAQASFARSVTSFQRQEASARGRVTTYENKIADAERHSARVVSIARRYVIRTLKHQRNEDDRRVQASLDDMAATKALYMEHMALKAPVEYWKQKAREHRTGAKTMRIALLCYAVLGTIALLAGLYYLFTRSIEVVTAGAPVSVLLILATMGIVVTTIAFWGGRILTRLYLSEEHLKIDAGERATMVETYLALTSIREASKEDRAIILASLFRPTADGLVKDDAAPDLSPAGILSKMAGPA